MKSVLVRQWWYGSIIFNFVKMNRVAFNSTPLSLLWLMFCAMINASDPTFHLFCGFKYPPSCFCVCCQALSISQSLNLSLSLRDRDRADTIITFHHTTPHHTTNISLKVTYTQVWYIIGIVSSSPTHFHSEKIGLIRVTYDPPVSIRVNKYYSDLYSSVIHHWNRQLKPYSYPLRKNRVN